MTEKKDEEQLPLPIPPVPIEGELLPKQKPGRTVYLHVDHGARGASRIGLALTLAILAALNGQGSPEQPRIEPPEDDEVDP